MKKLFIGTIAIVLASSAHAWGDREQGILAGAAATMLWQKLDQQSQPQQPPVYVYRPPQTPVYIQETVVTRVPQCTAWVETLNPNGTVTRTRTCTQ